MRAVPPLGVGCVLAAMAAAGFTVGRGLTAPVLWNDLLAFSPLSCALLLALLGAAGARTSRWRRRDGPLPGDDGTGVFLPVLLAGTFLLPPAWAALVGVPGALLSRADRRPAGLRRCWRAAQLALCVQAAGQVFSALGGRVALGGRPGGAGHGLPVWAGAPLWGGGRVVRVTSPFPYVLPDLPFVLLPAGAAVLVFCVLRTALDGVVLLTAERVPVRAAWRGRTAPLLVPAAVHGLAGLMMAVLWRSPYGPFAALLVLLPMAVSCWVFAQYHRERAAHRATIRALVRAVDIKDRYTRGHGERVGHASVLIARELGVAEERVEMLRLAGILHDIGKLGVPTRLLRKDGPLTPQERRIIELHPEYGHDIVRGIGFLGQARAAILHHHERLDGTGYPYGLAGHQIPWSARLVAVADAFDAMTSTRSYRRARPVDAALVELRRCAGAQFDPEMVEALATALERHSWQPTVTADGPDLPVPGGGPPAWGTATEAHPARFGPPAPGAPSARAASPAPGAPSGPLAGAGGSAEAGPGPASVAGAGELSAPGASSGPSARAEEPPAPLVRPGGPSGPARPGPSSGPPARSAAPSAPSAPSASRIAPAAPPPRTGTGGIGPPGPAPRAGTEAVAGASPGSGAVPRPASKGGRAPGAGADGAGARGRDAAGGGGPSGDRDMAGGGGGRGGGRGEAPTGADGVTGDGDVSRAGEPRTDAGRAGPPPARSPAPAPGEPPAPPPAGDPERPSAAPEEGAPAGRPAGSGPGPGGSGEAGGGAA